MTRGENVLYVSVGWLEFNVPFQHKYAYIRDELHVSDAATKVAGHAPDCNTNLRTLNGKLNPCLQTDRNWQRQAT